MMRLSRSNKNRTNAKKEAFWVYIKRKVKSIYKNLVKKEPKKTDNKVYIEEKLKRNSLDELKEIAKLRRIKNKGKLRKEGLITRILKSESSNGERNYIKHFSINTNVESNNNDDTYDGKIRNEISDIRMILSRLGNTITNNDRKKN